MTRRWHPSQGPPSTFDVLAKAERASARHRAAAARFSTGDLPCHRCGIRPGTTVDHVPALRELWDAGKALNLGALLPACPACNAAGGQAIALERGRAATHRPGTVVPLPGGTGGTGHWI